MNLFTGTAGYYRRYRPGIPTYVADLLADAVRDVPTRRLLDVGTGSGLMVAALLGRFDDVIAIDNDAQMLAAAEQALRPQLPDGTTLLLQQAGAEEFVPPPGWRADLVTICRAFHWLDQPAVLARLDDQVAPDGVVAVLGDQSLWTVDLPWTRAVRAVVQDFLGPQRRAGDGTFTDTDPRPYREIMRDSAFDDVDEHVVPVRRTWTADAVLGYLHSTSFAAPQLFGDRLAAFDDAVLACLARHSDPDDPDDPGDPGGLVEDNRFTVVLGRRGRS